ncbi:hypothetical protein O3G_MSEX003054 [Manduca sexta]|uniref:WW domain-containing protein n=1 Tax=Manduca sexta TaxID=7130 RepID=A0A921YQX1_MANSE|nr:hypothetical protein O3G_MSEX003054 [Manduca sexta]
MHSNKDVNGWVLCPSKSLPGKYYYFNVVSGEAVWSLPDAKVPPNNEIKNVAEKSHSFPEPEPIKYKNTNTGPNLQKSITKSTINKHANRPMFGQISFPEYMPNVNPSNSTNCSNSIFMTNNNDNRPLFGQGTKVVWAPLPLVVLEPNGTQTSDQVTQTCELDNIIVHSCDIPLSKRFINYENITIHFSEKNKLIRDKINTSTPIKPNPSFIDPIKPTVEHKIRKKPLIKDAILDLKNLKISDTKYSGTSTSNLFLQNQSDRKTQNILQSGKNSFAGLNLEEKEKKVATKKDDDQLNKNDLRLFLMARKRRYTEGDITTGSCERKKIKLKYTEDHEDLETPKKQVTFATNNTKTHKEISNEGMLTIQTLKNLAQSSCRQDVWYIVVDMDVLLENYDFVNDLVLSVQLDFNLCKNPLKARCAGASAGRARVLAARHVARALRDAPAHLALSTSMADVVQVDPQGFTGDLIEFYVGVTENWGFTKIYLV